ncbi:AraC family transcriptional regulator [Burkholderia guangdongensis]|uniref:AraC family transcriptional regulator n=1 Tax=Burkholderia guangdongensis TaxID=1792500 RepID=UPI0015C966CC|nr:AraC family transcriptional regulator [Burkholderia guangdongensis]
MDMTEMAVSREPAQRELAALIGRFAPVDGVHRTAIASLSFYKYSQPVDLGCGITHAAFVLAAQGAKRVMVAGHAYEYDDRRCLIASVDLPMMSRVTKASPDAPYLCVVLALDPQRIVELAAEMRLPEPGAMAEGEGIAVADVTPTVLDATLRLARLLETPADIPILAPLVEKELLYRLMTSEHGTRLRYMAVAGSQTNRIARAIEWIRDHYAEPMRVETLAQVVNMSVSSLHHHFKNVTTLSPLQYQKQLRLHEARRLLLGHAGDVASVAARVGYESASQFSREYSRLFGAPPLRDVVHLLRNDWAGGMPREEVARR